VDRTCGRVIGSADSADGPDADPGAMAQDEAAATDNARGGGTPRSVANGRPDPCPPPMGAGMAPTAPPPHHAIFYGAGLGTPHHGAGWGATPVTTPVAAPVVTPAARTPQSPGEIPAPSGNVGPLGRRCWAMGPRDGAMVCSEAAATYMALSDPTFDQRAWLARVEGSGGHNVMLTMGRSDQVAPLFGVGRFRSMDLGSALDKKHFGFVGNGSGGWSGSLRLAPPSTMSSLGTAITVAVHPEANMEAHYRANGARGFVSPPAGGQPREQVLVLIAMPVPNALVAHFCDCPHPFVAHQRVKWLQAGAPTGMKMALDPLRHWLRTACQANDARMTEMALLWEAAEVDNEDLALWAQRRFHALLPPEDPPGPTPMRDQTMPIPPSLGQGATAMTEEEIRLILRDESTRRAERDADHKGSRRMKPDEYRSYLGHAGLDPETPKEEAPPFVLAWERAVQNEPSMRVMLMHRVEASADILGMVNKIEQHTSMLVRDVRHLEFGGTMDQTHTNSLRGFSVCAVWNQLCTEEEGGERDRASRMLALASSTTVADHEKLEGRPGNSPCTNEEMILCLEQYLVHGHAIFELDGAHFVMVLRIVKLLRRLRVQLDQRQLNTIYWRIFVDARQFFRQREGSATSDLQFVVTNLSNSVVANDLTTPHDRLSPAKKRKTEPANGGGGGGGGRGGGGNKGGNEGGGQPASGGFGPLPNYHPALKSAWESAVVRIGSGKLLKDLVVFAKQANGDPHDMKTVGALLGRLCVVGNITGKCNNPRCSFDHNKEVLDSAATAVAEVVRKAVKKFKKQDG
jgi:hypothetical protein